MNLRWIVLKILDTIEFEGIFVHDAIDRFTDDGHLTKQDRGFIKKVVFGVIEQRIYLDYVINQFSKVKVKKMKPAIRHIMRLSVYQLLFMENIPESAVCNEAVKLVKKRNMYRLSGFVNGVLRSVIRSKSDIRLPDRHEDVLTYLSVKYSYDNDLIAYLLNDISEESVEQFLAVSNEEAPVTVRPNLQRCSTDELKNALEADGVQITGGKWLESALHISGYDRITSLDSFEKGLFQVQDESSMLVGHVAYEEGMTSIIDVCSAPGGKALHVADLMGSVGVVKAYDVSDHKLNLIRENVNRLGYETVQVSLADGTVFDESLENSADLVIADVPCSGLGIIRKKPDIKWNAGVDKIENLVELQRDIVQNVKRYVRPGGVLVYSTCTITDAENTGNVEWFLSNNPDFQLVAIEGPYADDESGMVKLMPITQGPDGFFIAKMRRKKED